MNEKTREMIAIGASVGAHCQPCLEHHVNKAREFGLTDDEISGAIAIGHMVEKGAMTAIKQFSSDILDAQTQKSSGGCCSGSTSRKKGCC